MSDPRHFTAEQDAFLRAAYAEGKGPREIGPLMTRSAKAISRRARMLGLAARGWRQPHDWNDAETARLLKLVGEGHSCDSAAKIMHVSRNAIIGKLHRLGRKVPITGWDFERSRKFRPRVQLEQTRPDNLKPLSVLGLSDCRFPFGDPVDEDFGFCGAPVTFKSPYCKNHHSICYQSASERAQ